MLSIEGLYFGIGDQQILNGVQLEIAKNQKVGIIGPNGSGKTTLFNCISGFNRAKSGKIHFAGQNITNYPPAARAEIGLGRLFQNFGIFREMTVLENILVALESKQKPSFFPWSSNYRNNIERSMEFLEKVQLGSKSKQKAGSLSGGQLRLLEITRLIAFGAKVLLLDEPTAGVSPRMKTEIESALKGLQEIDATVLIIEHDINFIHRLCERVVVLDMGEVVLDGTPEEIRTNPRLQEIYFGVDAQETLSVNNASAHR